jgi:hypothetical protein
MNLFHSKITNLLFLFIVATLIIACGGGSKRDKTPAFPREASEWLIPADQIIDGGPGPDGIPAIENPQFVNATSASHVGDSDIAIAVRHGGEVRIYPHDIMDWHEIVNDESADGPFTTSYCPLTGSAVTWQGELSHADPSFGVSGLLFNSNLLLYDRQTDSIWSQMYEISVSGSRSGEVAARMQVIEASFSTLRSMFPDARVMTRDTGFNRDYGVYPYGNYKEVSGLLFPVGNVDQRLHPKTRVIGIRSASGLDSTASKVYQLDGFGSPTMTINEEFEGQSIVVVGNSDLDFAAIYSRELSDGTILNFSPLDDDLPNVMSDDEGNTWDVFGTAVSGLRAGEQLAMTESYTAFWFAWVAFFPEAAIHFNQSAP